MQFKIGDRVRRVKGGRCGNLEIGDEGIVTKVDGSTSDNTYVTVQGSDAGHDIENIELVKSNITFMTNITEKFTLAFKKEPEKSFRLAGITNGDDFLTDDGMKIFLAWLLKSKGAEFKAEVVDDLLKEDKKA